jgi:hypothetical protein
MLRAPFDDKRSHLRFREAAVDEGPEGVATSQWMTRAMPAARSQLTRDDGASQAANEYSRPVSVGGGRQLSGRHSAKRLGELCACRLFFVSLAHKTALKHKATSDP